MTKIIMFLLVILCLICVVLIKKYLKVVDELEDLNDDLDVCNNMIEDLKTEMINIHTKISELQYVKGDTEKTQLLFENEEKKED